ncbi:prephenate dehydrogenase/arogenate dehydrogenase family protein [Bradyrhizobium sp. 930_D9_N1_4]|uniref:prephenate dehydrogenase/arogenate dehydrogenase family protein n=1 Tax=Bradyrhizobium sp. 930_D9_N1_4 TaxID=3240374 RepID=UPI003F8B3BE4
MKRALVVGGAGAVGSWMANVLQTAGSQVSLLDRISCSPQLDAEFMTGDVTAPDLRMRRLFAEIDILVLAIPAEVALAALDVLPGILRADCLLVDTLSTKAGFCEALQKSLPASPAVGINPLFRPSASKVHGGVAWVPYNEGSHLAELEARLAKQGLQFVQMSPLEHDETMAAVQTLVHTLVLAFGATLLRSNVKLAALTEILPPPFRCMSALLGRVVSGEPHVYWEIQRDNPFSKAARSGLSDALSELDRLIDADNFDGYKRLFDQLLSSGTIDAAASERMGRELFRALDRVAAESRDASPAALRGSS